MALTNQMLQVEINNIRREMENMRQEMTDIKKRKEKWKDTATGEIIKLIVALIAGIILAKIGLQ